MDPVEVAGRQVWAWLCMSMGLVAVEDHQESSLLCMWKDQAEAVHLRGS
jgi:hypothetical protein